MLGYGHIASQIHLSIYFINIGKLCLVYCPRHRLQLLVALSVLFPNAGVAESCNVLLNILWMCMCVSVR